VAPISAFPCVFVRTTGIDVNSVKHPSNFLSFSDRQALISNMFAEMKGREILLCVDRQCSHTMERLLPAFGVDRLRELICALLATCVMRGSLSLFPCCIV